MYKEIYFPSDKWDVTELKSATRQPLWTDWDWDRKISLPVPRPIYEGSELLDVVELQVLRDKHRTDEIFSQDATFLWAFFKTIGVDEACAEPTRIHWNNLLFNFCNPI